MIQHCAAHFFLSHLGVDIITTQYYLSIIIELQWPTVQTLRTDDRLINFIAILKQIRQETNG